MTKDTSRYSVGGSENEYMDVRQTVFKNKKDISHLEVTARPFKIVKQELEFYRKMKLPVPHLHPDERHKRRMALRNPRKLWNRKCDKCGKEIQTTYSPERPETVLCEECYLKEVY